MQGASPLASPGLNGARHWRNYGQPFAFALAANRRFPDVGHLYGCLCKCRKRLGAGVPGAEPPAKQTLGLPLPRRGRGSGGWGQESKLKARQAGNKEGKPPLRFPQRQGQPVPPWAEPPLPPPLPSFPFPQQSPHKENHAVDERREENRQNNMRENTEPEKADRRNRTRRESRGKHAE